MPSPFPGVDPFLEGHGLWREFHNAFIVAAQERILEALPEKYDCPMEVELFLRERSAEERIGVGRADWAVGQPRTTPNRPPEAGSGNAVGTVAPSMRSVLPPAVDEEYRNLLHITDRSGERLVCVVELLSPSNKSGGDRTQYLNKRRQIERSDAHLVEIDLLRGGRRLPIGDEVPLPFVVLVGRADERPEVDLWTFGLRDSLPVIPIPLADDDPPLPLPLAEVFDRTYDRGRYSRRAYRFAPDPPLSAEDAAWAAAVLTDAGVPLPPGFPPDQRPDDGRPSSAND
ncbi:DUF4058 family protein [Alienimonas californiensis]|uniref:DUF4058 domain-containing protein n=1 Tax=Alienimonas californiensis TaxID=2527989 RepID=A0A517P9P1_9PLAN|nr:DUF4058 family protein [Alienimonas californiensis]QDT16093.1 hypothetical protein CA12_21910 [Alienimonas californiensis]